MPRKRSTDIVDGFSVYKAAQRATTEPQSQPQAPVTPPRPAPPDEPAKIGTHIGRTVLPTRHDIICYECAYEFQLTGKADTTFCPKCRKSLLLGDHQVKGAWTGELKTAGTVHITKDGCVKSGQIHANSVILEGTVEKGALHAFQWLELRGAALFDPAKMMSKDLRIGSGMNLIVPDVEYRNVDVHGVLKSKILASGLVTVRASGLIEGAVTAPRFVVEEGGGVRAQIRIQPAEPASAETEMSAARSA